MSLKLEISQTYMGSLAKTCVNLHLWLSITEHLSANYSFPEGFSFPHSPPQTQPCRRGHMLGSEWTLVPGFPHQQWMLKAFPESVTSVVSSLPRPGTPKCLPNSQSVLGLSLDLKPAFEALMSTSPPHTVLTPSSLTGFRRESFLKSVAYSGKRWGSLL